MQLLARYGVPEYWIVDPAKNTLEVYVSQTGAYELAGMFGDNDTVTSPTLPGLRFDARRLFTE